MVLWALQILVTYCKIKYECNTKDNIMYIIMTLNKQKKREIKS